MFFTRRARTPLAALAAALVFISSSVTIPTRAQTGPVSVATGFDIQRFAEPANVDEFSQAYSGPLSMAFDSRGRLFVGCGSAKILILLDTNEDGRVDDVKTFATGVPLPLGLEFRANGDLFATSNLVGGVGRIMRLRDLDGDDVADEKTILIDNLPSEGDHQTDRLKFGPDGLLYFGQGSSTDAGQPKPGLPPERPLNATIQRFDVDNPASLETFASGLRNPFGMAFHPGNGQLFTTDGGSGELCQFNCSGEDFSPPEEVNWVVAGGNYGFPGCEGPPDASKPACAGVRAGITHFNPHLTPTSIAFYTGPQAGESVNQMLVTIYKRIHGEGGDLRRFTISGSAATGFQATEVLPRIADFGIIDPFDGPVETAIDPITGDIYVARFDPVSHRDPNEHHQFIYRIHRIGSDAMPFIGRPQPSAVKAGSAGLTISLTVRHVKPGATVFNVTDNVPLATRQGASAFELLADVPASAIAGERTITLEVRNPDGGHSNQQPFAVTRNVPPPPIEKTPQLASMFVYKKKRSKVVEQLTAGMAAKKFRLVVSGTDFDASAQLLVNNSALEIESASETELVGRMTNGMVASPGELVVQVRNSTGKVSNTLKLVVTP